MVLIFIKEIELEGWGEEMDSKLKEWWDISDYQIWYSNNIEYINCNNILWLGH